MLVTGWFATTEIHSFTVLEDKSVMQVSAGLVPSVASEGESVLCLSPILSWLQAILGVLGS